MVYVFPQQFFAVYWRTRPEVFCKKAALKTFAKLSGKHLRRSLFFNKAVSFLIKFIKKETPALVLSFEFYEIFKGMQLY